MIPGRVGVVIAGGGLSGLSLAAHLAATGWHDREVLVVDDPAARQPATCWASWSTGSGLLDTAAGPTFRKLRVYAAGTSIVLPLHRYRYQLVRRTDLTRVATGLLAGHPGYTIHKGRVERIREDDSGAEVEIDGATVRADWVFDSVGAASRSPLTRRSDRQTGQPDRSTGRPDRSTDRSDRQTLQSDPRNEQPPDAWMAFTGWEVSSAAPVFDSQTPVLFDFRTPQAHGARFVYVLPDDEHRALVELTEFMAGRGEPPSPRQRREALARYLAEVLHCEEFTVSRTESAVLPLRVRPPDRGRGRVVAIGARAGLVKASTGYAYQRIQRDSRAIAASMVRHGHPFEIPAPRRRHQLLDALLLEVLARDPRQVERAFGRMFTRLGADRVLRFLDEETNLAEEMGLMACVQPLPFLTALARHAVHR